MVVFCRSSLVFRQLFAILVGVSVLSPSPFCRVSGFRVSFVWFWRQPRRWGCVFGRLRVFPPFRACGCGCLLLLRFRRFRPGPFGFSVCFCVSRFRVFRFGFGCVRGAGGCYGPCAVGFAVTGVHLLSWLLVSCWRPAFSPVGGRRFRLVVRVCAGVRAGRSGCSVSAGRHPAARLVGRGLAAAWRGLVFLAAGSGLAFLAGLFCCISANARQTAG